MRRVQQSAQGQRPHGGYTKSAVSPARFAAEGWVAFQRKNHGLRARFADSILNVGGAVFRADLMRGETASRIQLALGIRHL